MTTTLHRPEPILRHRARPVDRRDDPRHAASRLMNGETLVVTDSYRTGAEILCQLDALMEPPGDGASYQARQSARRTHRETALRLLAPITNNRLALDHRKPIGFLQELYPEVSTFALPIAQIQELFGAWKRYEEGVHLAVLGHRVHPFYGTYVPTRLAHLELFGTWLSQHKGPRERAVDVGTGCGVLALMMCRAGFPNVLATDTNPNAIESVTREVGRRPTPPPITPVHVDLLGEGDDPFDVIVFNPPWMHGTVDGLLDRALYFDDDLFERFFDRAHARLAESGRIAIVFSNVMQLVQPDQPHPIQRELDAGRLRLVQQMKRKIKHPPDENGRRRHTRERVEIWELARA
ncbi:MAG: methyltransferase [Myxococcota bacterium]